MKTMDLKAKSLKEANDLLRKGLNGTPFTVKNAAGLYGLAAGLKHGEIMISGDGGDYLGALNAGATIHVTRNVGNFVGDNMTSGSILVDGSAAYGAAQYCYGGTVVIRGDAGDFTATMNKGAVILVNGNVGDEVGTFMLKGDLVVVGNAGDNFANYLIRGSVYLGGQYSSLGHNTRVVPMADEDIARLRTYFDLYQVQADPTHFKKIVAASEKPFYH